MANEKCRNCRYYLKFQNDTEKCTFTNTYADTKKEEELECAFSM